MNSKPNHHENKVRDTGAEPSGVFPPGMLRKLGRDAGRYYPAAVIPAVAGLIGFMIYTRVFDSSDYGRYSLALAAVALINTMSCQWIQQTILRFLPRYKSRNELPGFISKVVGLVTAVCLVLAVILLIAYFVARRHLGPYAELYLPALVLLVAEIIFLSVNSIYRAGLKSKQSAVFKISSAVVRLACALVFIFFVRRDVVGLLMGVAVGQLLVVLPAARGLRIFSDGKLPRPKMDRGFLSAFAAYGVPMVGWAMGVQLLNISNRFIIGAFRGSAEVGIYSANSNLVNMGFGLVTIPLLMAAHPLIMTAWEKKKRDDVPGIISEISRYYVLAAFPIVVLVAVFSAELVQLLLGPDFREGHRITPLILAGSTVWGLAQLGHKGLEIMEKTRVMFSLIAVSAGVSIALNLVFVPRYGYHAAAVTMVISFVLYAVLVYFTVRSHVRWLLPWRDLGKIFAAALITGSVLFLTKSRLPAGIPIIVVLLAGAAAGFCLYAVLLVATKEIKKDELSALLRKK